MLDEKKMWKSLKLAAYKKYTATIEPHILFVKKALESFLGTEKAHLAQEILVDLDSILDSIYANTLSKEQQKHLYTYVSLFKNKQYAMFDHSLFEKYLDLASDNCVLYYMLHRRPKDFGLVLNRVQKAGDNFRDYLWFCISYLFSLPGELQEKYAKEIAEFKNSYSFKDILA